MISFLRCQDRNTIIPKISYEELHARVLLGIVSTHRCDDIDFAEHIYNGEDYNNMFPKEDMFSIYNKYYNQNRPRFLFRFDAIYNRIRNRTNDFNGSQCKRNNFILSTEKLKLCFKNYVGTDNSNIYLLENYSSQEDITKFVNVCNINVVYNGMFDLFQIVEINDAKISFLVKSHERKIDTTRSDFIDKVIRFPDTIIIATISSTISFGVFIIDTDTFDQKSIKSWPYGNVYGGGSVCWGRVTLPSLSTFINKNSMEFSLDMFMLSCYKLFFDSKFNGDLVSRNFDIAEDRK